MNDNLTVIIGALLPLFISTVVQPGWSKTVKQVIAVVIAIAVGLVNVAVQDSFHGWGDTLTSLAVVVGAAQAAYALIWNRIGATDAIEKVTSPSPEPAAP